MAPETSHILFTDSDFIFFIIPILKVLCVQLEWLKSLNFEDPFRSSTLVPQLL